MNCHAYEADIKKKKEIPLTDYLVVIDLHILSIYYPEKLYMF